MSHAAIARVPLAHPLRICPETVEYTLHASDCVSVDHPGSIFANPFKMGRGATLEQAKESVARFEDWLIKGPDSQYWHNEGETDWGLWARMIAELPKLRGKKLIVGSDPDWPSFADVLARLANAPTVPVLKLVFVPCE